MSKKTVEWAICAIRNEEEDIIGAAKTCQYFAENVLYSVDPHTTDKTLQILEEQFPDVIVVMQDRSLGDSDNEIEGEFRILIARANLEKAVNKHVDFDEWFLMMAPDERFDIKDFKRIESMVKGVDNLGYKGIAFPSLHTYAPKSNTQCIDYYSLFTWGNIKPIRFMKMEGFWHNGSTPHSGYDLPAPYFVSPIPMYHYCWLKESRKAYQTWRDQQKFKDCPFYTHQNPMLDWRTMPYLNDRGEII